MSLDKVAAVTVALAIAISTKAVYMEGVAAAMVVQDSELPVAVGVSVSCGLEQLDLSLQRMLDRNGPLH